MLHFVDKFVLKFNTLVLLMLRDLCAATNDADLKKTLTLLESLCTMDGANTTLVENFMNAIQGKGDMIHARNSEVLSCFNSDQISADMPQLYSTLSSTDQDVVWKYMSKLLSLGGKACPDLQLVQEDFDMTALVPSPDAAVVVVTKKKKKPSVLNEALDTSLKAYYTAANVDPATQPAFPDTTAFIKRFNDTFDSTHVVDLVMDPEPTLIAHGLPLLSGVQVTSTVSQALCAAAKQIATVYITLTQFDSSIVKRIEKIAEKLTKEMGSSELSGLSQDPMALMATLATSQCGSDIMKLMADMKSGSS
jgi:hypothetical protein